jgi:hypothetical protein
VNFPLASLASAPRWVAWQSEGRSEGKPTKLGSDLCHLIELLDVINNDNSLIRPITSLTYRLRRRSSA